MEQIISGFKVASEHTVQIEGHTYKYILNEELIMFFEDYKNVIQSKIQPSIEDAIIILEYASNYVTCVSNDNTLSQNLMNMYGSYMKASLIASKLLMLVCGKLIVLKQSKEELAELEEFSKEIENEAKIIQTNHLIQKNIK